VREAEAVRVVSRLEAVAYGLALLEGCAAAFALFNAAALDVVNYGTRVFAAAGIAYLVLFASGLGLLLVVGRGQWARRSWQYLWMTSGLMLLPLSLYLYGAWLFSVAFDGF
jgi:hypothetical protein